MAGRKWADWEDRVIESDYPDSTVGAVARRLDRTERAVYGRAHLLGVGKSEAFKRSAASGRLTAQTGVASRFPPGNEPWNKGRKGWKAGGRSAETRFKGGHKPHNWVPVGTEVELSDGFIKVKVRDDAPAGMSRRNWKMKHELEWEAHHGAVPTGHCLRFRDGDRSNTHIDNLELVSRAENATRNSIHRYPPEVVEVMRLKGVLKRQIGKRSKA